MHTIMINLCVSQWIIDVCILFFEKYASTKWIMSDMDCDESLHMKDLFSQIISKVQN